MPFTRKPRPFTEKQQIACRNRKSKGKGIFNPLAAPGSGPFPPKPEAEPKKHLDKLLDEFLHSYDVRLLEIDRRYPLGNPDRPEWLDVHRKNGIRQLMEIARGKAVTVLAGAAIFGSMFWS